MRNSPEHRSRGFRRRCVNSPPHAHTVHAVCGDGIRHDSHSRGKRFGVRTPLAGSRVKLKTIAVADIAGRGAGAGTSTFDDPSGERQSEIEGRGRCWAPTRSGMAPFEDQPATPWTHTAPAYINPLPENLTAETDSQRRLRYCGRDRASAGKQPRWSPSRISCRGGRSGRRRGLLPRRGCPR